MYKTVVDILTKFNSLIYKAHLLCYNKITLGKNIYISPKAVVSTSKSYSSTRGHIAIGDGTKIHEYANIYSGKKFVKIGKNSSINAYCVVNGDGGVTIGDDVRIANHTSIISANHNFGIMNKPIHHQGITALGIEIKDDVWIGSGVKILDGVTIGKGAVVGAGSVVTKSIPNYCVYAGVPAKLIKKRA